MTHGALLTIAQVVLSTWYKWYKWYLVHDTNGTWYKWYLVQVVLGTLVQVVLGTLVYGTSGTWYIDTSGTWYKVRVVLGIWCKLYLVHGASCNHSPSRIIVTLCLVRITSTVSILHCIFLVLCPGVPLNVVILTCHCTLYTDINL